MSKAPSYRFIWFSVSALTGGTLPVFLSGLPSLWLLLPLTGLIACLAVRYAWLGTGFYALLGFTWVCGNASVALDRILPAELEKLPLMVTGRVLDLPQREGDRLRILLGVEESGTKRLFGGYGKIMLNCYRCNLDTRAGERWQFRVKLKRPSGSASPGAFDYEKWLFRNRIVATGHLIDGRAGGDNRKLADARWFDNQVWRGKVQSWILSTSSLSPRAAGLYRALLIGDRGGLSDQDWRILRITGVAHLVAISGLHIGLIMLAVTLLARRLFNLYPRLYTYCPGVWIFRGFGLAAALGYAALAGFGLPTQRALVMIAIFTISGFSGREMSLFQLLFSTVALLLLIDPFIAFDTGFWLSFGAVFVIAWGTSGLRGISWITVQPRLWLGMMPLLILFFGQVSLVAPFANLVAIPLVSFLLLPVGLLAVVAAGLGLETVGTDLLGYCGRVADLGLTGLETLAGLPMASVNYTPSDSINVLLIILGVAMMTTPFQLYHPVIYAGLAALAFLPAPEILKPGEFRVALLDVGQGLSMVITTAQTTTIYDTGPRFDPGFDAGEAVLLPYLRKKQISRVDRLIVSHGDNDHIGGSASLLHTYRIPQIMTSVPDRLPGSRLCEAGEVWIKDEVKFEVLGPDSLTPAGSNNRSCVVRVSSENGSILISGDIEKEVEMDLVSRTPASLSADILLVPHQGSRTSSRPVFLERVSPRIALVASGYLNSYGHPHEDVLVRYSKRNIPVLNTAYSGTITVTFASGGISSQEYRESHRKFWYRRGVNG